MAERAPEELLNFPQPPEGVDFPYVDEAGRYWTDGDTFKSKRSSSGNCTGVSYSPEEGLMMVDLEGRRVIGAIGVTATGFRELVAGIQAGEFDFSWSNRG